MTRLHTLLTLGIIMWCFHVAFVYGNGFYAPLYGANHLGVSGAALTMPRFADTVSINPAGMVRLSPGWHLSVGAVRVTGGFDWEGSHPDTGESDSASSVIGGKAIPHFQLVHTSDAQTFSYGLGLKTPYANGMNWPSDWAGRELGTYGEIGVLSINPNIAYALDEEHSIAAGIGYSLGFAHAKQALRVPHLTNEALGFAGQDLGTIISQFEGNASAWNIAYLGNIGSLLIGALYTSVLTMTLDGTLDYPPETTLPGFSYQDLNGSITLSFPWIFEMSVGWKDDLVNPTFEFELGWMRGGWSVYKEVITDLDQPDQFSARSPTASQFEDYEDESGHLVRGATQLKEPRHYQDANTYRMGLLWHIHESFGVMTGITIDENVVPPNYREPMMAIGDSRSFSLGLEWGVGDQQTIGISSTWFTLQKNSLDQTQFLVTNGTPVDLEAIAANQSIRRVPFNGTITGTIMIIAISYHVSL